MESSRQRSEAAVGLATLAVVVSGVVLLAKGGAWWVSGSMVLFADAAESGLDVLTSSLLLFAVRMSARPPDAGHPWGHGKVEYFTSGFQGALILAVGVGVGVEAARALNAGPTPLDLSMGVGLSVVATAINVGLATLLIRRGAALGSPALQADGHHNLADVITTLGGWVGLGMAWLTGWWVLDPLVAVAVAVHVVWTGASLARDAVNGLMDASLPQSELDALTAAFDDVIASAGTPARWDGLRARRSSHDVFVECTLRVPGSTPVATAHETCDRLEAAAAAVMPGAEVLVHVEPDDRSGPPV